MVKQGDDGFTYKCIGCQQWILMNKEVYLPSLDGCFCPSCRKESDHKEPCTECENLFELHELNFEVDPECPLCEACKQSWEHGYKIFKDQLGLSPRKLALTQMLCHMFLIDAGFKVEFPKQFKWGITEELLQRLVPKFDKWMEADSVPFAVRVSGLVNTNQIVRDMRNNKKELNGNE